MLRFQIHIILNVDGTEQGEYSAVISLSRATRGPLKYTTIHPNVTGGINQRRYEKFSSLQTVEILQSADACSGDMGRLEICSADKHT
jgi:hypothetical protein